MSATRSAWRTGWTAEDPAYVGFAWAPNDGGTYEPLKDDGLVARDLGLDAASTGVIGANRIRVADAEAAGDWRSLDADFDFLYVISGSVRVDGGDGRSVTLGTGGCAVHPSRYAYRFAGFSDDFEAVHITSPAEVQIARGDAARRAAGAPAHEPIYTHDLDDQYRRGDGPRAFFLYRDLGTRGPTSDRIHFHVVRATEPGVGTGWHYHSMSQWFMVIGGSADISVEDHRKVALGWGDAMCIGAGAAMRHNVTDFSADYLVLEMCIPAEYETIAVPRPEGGAQTPI